MIILKNLEWTNCFSYGDNNSISLAEDRITQVIGLNGSGKSSIPLILEEVLFNKNSKGIKKSEIANRYKAGAYKIVLSFSKDTDEYVLSVSRDKTLKAELTKNEQDVSSHTATNTYKQVEQIIGLDFKTFSQLVYQNTNSSLAFLTATDTERKKFLIELLNLEKYLEYHDIFKETLKDLSNTKIAIESKIDTLNNWVEENKLSSEEILPLIDCDISTEPEEILQASLKEKIANIIDIRKKISNNNLYKKQLEELDLSIYTNIKETELIPYEDKVKLTGVIKADVQRLRKSKEKILSLEDKCPTCEQNIDENFKESMLSDIDSEEQRSMERYKALQAEIKEAKEFNALISAKAEAEKNFQSLYRQIDNSLPDSAPKESDLQKQLTKVREVIKTKKAEVEKVSIENLRRERNNAKIRLVQEQKESTYKKLERATKDLEETEHLYAKLEVLKKAFSTNGLIAYKIENSVKELEDLVNEYLVELSDGRFSIGFIVEKDKLNVQIFDNGSLISIEALSSGELARVNTSTLLAIRKLMSSLSKTHLNVLFLDEVINVLDEVGKEKLVEVLAKEDRLNCFIVSHQWTHPLLAKINIVKENKISKVDNGY